MDSIHIKLTKQQISDLNKLVEVGEFATISEAIRCAVRMLIEDARHRGLIE